MSHAKTIFSNLVSLSVGEFIGKGLMFFVTLYLARVLEPEAFGQYSFVVAFISFFYITSQMGLDSFGSREIAKYREKAVYYLNAVMSLKLVMSVLNYIFLLVLVYFLNLDPIVSDMLLIFGLSIFANALLTEFYFSGLEKMVTVGIGKIIRPVIFASLVFLFIHSKTDLIWVPTYYVLGSFASTIYLIFAAYRKNNIQFNVQPYRKFLGVSFILGLSSLLAMVNFQIDKLIIPIFDTFENLGLYESSVRILFLVFIIFSTIWSVFMPRITKLINDKKNFNIYFTYYSRLVLFFGFGFAGSFFIFSTEIISLFYGSEYLGADRILFLFGFAIILYALSSIFLTMLFSFHKEKLQVKFILVSSIVNVFFNFLLIPMYGVFGAGIATIISTFLLVFISYFSLKSLISFNWMLFNKFILLSFLIWAIFIYILPDFFWLLDFIIYSLFYLIFLFVFRIFTFEDVLSIKRLLN